MAKVSRYAQTRIASTINARYHPDEVVVDSYYLDGRFPSRRDSRAVDLTTVREDRGFFYGLFAHPKDGQKATSDMPFAAALEKLNNEVRSSGKNIDEQINDLADVAVEVTGRATLAREGVRQSWFSGILVKEGEIAAITTTTGCALLYRGDVLYPLTDSDFNLEAIDYNGNPIDGITDYVAGSAGTIRYSNIAQLKPNDCIILCNRELFEALGQRELLRLLFEAEDQMEAAQQIMTTAAAKAPTVTMQVLLAFVEDVNLQSKTGRLNLGLFNTSTTPSPQDIQRSELVQDPSLDVEEKESNMRHSNNNYGDRNGRNDQHPEPDPQAWSDNRVDEFSDAAFAPPRDGVESDQMDYGQQDQYGGEFAERDYEDGSYQDPNFDQTYSGDYSDPYAGDDYSQPYADEYQQDYGSGYDSNYNEYADYDGYSDQYDGYNDQYSDGYDDQYGDDYDAQYDDGYGAGYGDDNYDDGYYDDGYYDEYYDDYEDYERREKIKRLVILGVALLVLVLAIFFLVRKLSGAGSKETETETEVETTQSEIESATQTEPPLVKPIESQSQPEPATNQDELFSIDFVADANETPRAFITAIYGKDDTVYYEFLKRFNPTIPDIDSGMSEGTTLKVPVAESGPFKILDSWLQVPEIKQAYDEGVQKAREAKESRQQSETSPSTTEFAAPSESETTDNN